MNITAQGIGCLFKSYLLVKETQEVSKTTQSIAISIGYPWQLRSKTIAEDSKNFDCGVKRNPYQTHQGISPVMASSHNAGKC